MTDTSNIESPTNILSENIYTCSNILVGAFYHILENETLVDIII